MREISRSQFACTNPPWASLRPRSTKWIPESRDSLDKENTLLLPVNSNLSIGNYGLVAQGGMPAAAAKRRRGEAKEWCRSSARGEPQDLKPKPAADARSFFHLSITVLAVSVCMLERAGAEPGTLTVTTLAGEYRNANSFANSIDGTGASAVLIESPRGLDMWWPAGDSVLFLSHKSELRRLQVATKEVSTLATAPFQWDAGDLAASKLRVAPTGEAAYIVNKYSIYKVDLTNNTKYEVPSTPWVGTNSEPPSDASDTMHARYYSSQADAVGTNAGFHTILWTDFAPDGASLIVLDGFPEVDDAYRVKIRRVNCNTAQVSTIGFVHHDDADGNLLKDPQSLAVSPDGQSVFITEFGKHRIVKADISANKNYDESNVGDAIMCSCTCGEANCYACGNAHCMWCGSHPKKDFFEFPSACAITATIVAGSVLGTAGFANGVGTHASFKGPWSLDLSPDGAALLITEAQGHGSLGGTIRALEISSATVSTVAGSPGDLCVHCDTCTARSCDGDVVKASFNVFSGAVYGTSKTQIYVGDYQVIRQIAPPAANSSTTAARTTGIFTTASPTDTSPTSVIASSSTTTVFSSSFSTDTPLTTSATIAGAGAETTTAEGRMGSTSAPGTSGGSTPAASSSSTPAPTTWSSIPYSSGSSSSTAGAGAETTTAQATTMSSSTPAPTSQSLTSVPSSSFSSTPSPASTAPSIMPTTIFLSTPISSTQLGARKRSVVVEFTMAGFDSAAEFEGFGDVFKSGVSIGIGVEIGGYTSDDVFFLKLCQGIDCKEFLVRRAEIPLTELQLTFGVWVRSGTDPGQLEALLRSASFLEWLAAYLSRMTGKSIRVGLTGLAQAILDNIVSNVSVTTAGTPAPVTSGLQQTPIAFASESMKILPQIPRHNADDEEISGARMGMRDILLLAGGMMSCLVCSVGTTIMMNRRSRPQKDVPGTDEQQILAFLMARHCRLGAGSPASELDDRVMRLILQLAGLVYLSPGNSEGNDLANEFRDESTGFDGMRDEIPTDSSGSSEGWSSETSDDYSEYFIDVPYMDREVLKRRRDDLLEMMKEDRSKRRKQGDPESSDDEKDLRKVDRQIQIMARQLRKKDSNPSCDDQRALERVSLDADGVEQRRRHLLKLMKEQKKCTEIRGGLVSSSDEERDMRRVDAQIQGMACLKSGRRNRGESEQLESLLMDPEGVQKRRELLLEMMKNERSRRRQKGEAVSSSDEEQDRRRVDAEMLGMALQARRPVDSRRRNRGESEQLESLLMDPEVSK